MTLNWLIKKEKSWKEKKHAEIDAERPSASEVNVSTDDSQDPQITLA